jgi:hypothetical protein
MNTVISTDLGNARCIGVHHTDESKVTSCNSCGVAIVKAKKGYVNAKSGDYGYIMTCWSPVHVCEEERVEIWTNYKNYQIVEGKIVKGQIVTVVRGRKVAKGTTGEIRWIGEDSYGKTRIGIYANEEMHFTALTNVEVVTNEGGK